MQLLATFMTGSTLQDLLMPPVLSMIVALICYGHGRALQGGRPLTPFMRSLTAFACLFALGMGYAIVFRTRLTRWLDWEQAWVAATLAWALTLSLFAWWRRSRSSRHLAPADKEY